MLLWKKLVLDGNAVITPLNNVENSCRGPTCPHVLGKLHDCLDWQVHWNMTEIRKKSGSCRLTYHDFRDATRHQWDLHGSYMYRLVPAYRGIFGSRKFWGHNDTLRSLSRSSGCTAQVGHPLSLGRAGAMVVTLGIQVCLLQVVYVKRPWSRLFAAELCAWLRSSLWIPLPVSGVNIMDVCLYTVCVFINKKEMYVHITIKRYTLSIIFVISNSLTAF